MKISTYTVEGSELQTTYLANALLRAKKVANTVKKQIIVFIDGKTYCKVAKNGKLLMS